MADYGNEISLAAHLDPEDAEAAVSIVERYALDQPGQCLHGLTMVSYCCLGRGGTGHPRSMPERLPRRTLVCAG